MKKIIVAALSVILGTFGYTVVDQAIEDRVANLEAKVSIQQSIIDELNIDDADLRLAADMPIGSTMPCIPSEPITYKLEDGTEVLIERFTNTVVEHRPLGEFGSGGFAHSCYEVEITGKTDPLYSGCTIYFVYVDNTEAVNYGCESIINSDGSFCAKSIPRGFTREFISEIREIWISGTTTSSSSTTTPTTYPIATTTRPTLTTKPTTITTTPFETTTTALNVEGGYCGDYATWKIENGTLIISGTGAMYDATPGWYDYKDQINSIIINEGITTISDYAFGGVSMMHHYRYKSIVIPDSVISIGDSAFEDCHSLTSVTFGENSQLTSIGNYAFRYCSSLNSLTLPNSITSIGSDAFYGCSSLTSISLPNNLKQIYSYTFYNCKNLTTVNIPDNVTSVGSNAFEGCTNLKSIVIGNGIKSIGQKAFRNCSSLTSIAIPDGVTSIGNYVFDGCSSLETATIGDGLGTVSYQAFYNCTNLKTVYIGSNVMTVGEMAFAGCGNITDVYYAGTQEQWNAITFEASNARLTDATIHFEN